jgi:heparin/heparan-sulfate lyase
MPMPPSKNLLSLAALLISAAAAVAATDETGLLADGSWIKAIRPDHPRMIFTAADLPRLRVDAAGRLRPEFEALKQEVDAFPAKAELIFREELIERRPDGTIRAKRASQYGHLMFKYDGSSQAVRAALLYLVTSDRKYFDIARAYLRLSNQVLWKSAEVGVWADWQSNSRINAILAYDWIYNELSPEERREIMLPMLDYISKSRTGGAFKFRRTTGGPQSGNYGEDALQLFAGIAAYGDGIDDATAADMLRRGAELFVEMLDYREALSAGSGLLTSSTIGYSFGPYPYATFFFFHLWRSAFGAEVADRWMQMCDYPKWFDFAAIRIDPIGRFLSYGIGDTPHTDNLGSALLIYTHMAQSIHFYGQNHPEKVLASYATIKRLPDKVRVINRMYPFLPFALYNFDPAKIDAVDTAAVDSGRYFYNAGFGLLLLRSGIGEDDTFAAFRFGSKQKVHQHYDELSFVIYKRGFLALDAGSRASTAHHQNFAAQTVAHNTILIHQDKEPIAPFWKPWGFKDDGKTYESHGGQLSTTAATALALQSTPDFIYAAGDATKSYAASKCEEAVRQFVWIKPDLFVIYDRVTSVAPEQRKEVLFHTQNRPEQLGKNTFRADNGGVLFINTLLPENAAIRVEGGPGREFWASGRNWELEGGDAWDKTYTVTGKWRLEVSDGGPAAKRGEFLHVLKAALPDGAENVAAACRTDEKTATVSFAAPDGTKWELAFNRTGDVGLRIIQTAPDGRVKFDAALPNRIESRP